MAEAPQQAHLTSPKRAEVGTDFESSPYDELAASRNGKQRCRFVDEYVITSVASEAVTTAGYKTRHPRQKGWELMRIPLVKASTVIELGDRHGASLQPEPSWTVGMRGAPSLRPRSGPTLPNFSAMLGVNLPTASEEREPQSRTLLHQACPET